MLSGRFNRMRLKDRILNWKLRHSGISGALATTTLVVRLMHTKKSHSALNNEVYTGFITTVHRPGMNGTLNASLAQ